MKNSTIKYFKTNSSYEILVQDNEIYTTVIGAKEIMKDGYYSVREHIRDKYFYIPFNNIIENIYEFWKLLQIEKSYGEEARNIIDRIEVEMNDISRKENSVFLKRYFKDHIHNINKEELTPSKILEKINILIDKCKSEYEKNEEKQPRQLTINISAMFRGFRIKFNKILEDGFVNDEIIELLKVEAVEGKKDTKFINQKKRQGNGNIIKSIDTSALTKVFDKECSLKIVKKFEEKGHSKLFVSEQCILNIFHKYKVSEKIDLSAVNLRKFWGDERDSEYKKYKEHKETGHYPRIIEKYFDEMNNLYLTPYEEELKTEMNEFKVYIKNEVQGLIDKYFELYYHLEEFDKFVNHLPSSELKKQEIVLPKVYNEYLAESTIYFGERGREKERIENLLKENSKNFRYENWSNFSEERKIISTGYDLMNEFWTVTNNIVEKLSKSNPGTDFENLRKEFSRKFITLVDKLDIVVKIEKLYKIIFHETTKLIAYIENEELS